MFQFFSNIVKNIEVDVFFKKSPKNRIVKNWKTLYCEKHRIVKKSEHRPPLVAVTFLYLLVSVSRFVIKDFFQCQFDHWPWPWLVA